MNIKSILNYKSTIIKITSISLILLIIWLWYFYFKSSEEKYFKSSEEKMKSNPLYCRVKSDCTVQDNCFSCVGNILTNKYHYKEIKCSVWWAIWNAYCFPSDIKCIDNTCKQVLRKLK